MPFFETVKDTLNGQLGQFDFSKENLTTIETPYMFPVTFLVTGTTARGGATWKYVLQADQQFGLMRQNRAILSEVLHFLNYDLSPNKLQKWRDRSIRGLYRDEVFIDYRGPIFLDSGGFRLMWRDGLDLSKFGIDLSPDKEAASIFHLQRDFGGNIVASLDYPLPPGLSDREQTNRMKRSLENALRVATLIRDKDGYKPFLYMAVHGMSEKKIGDYVKNLYKGIKERGLEGVNAGIAIGSLVPMRSAGRASELIRLVWAASHSVPKKLAQVTPIHTFGLSGTLIPFLVYCGVDTFDSSTYMQEARVLNYFDPKTRRKLSFYDVTQAELNSCECPICRNLNIREAHDAFLIGQSHKLLPNGHYKSKYYADIALHNLWVENQILEQTRLALLQGRLVDYMVDIASRTPSMQTVLEALADCDPSLKTVVTRRVKPIAKVAQKPILSKTLTHTPSDFNINANGYSPATKEILLLVPCSAEKPYSSSTTHRFLTTYLDQAIPYWRDYVHKVTLSGLYGPVPEECEKEDAVLTYEFRLVSENTKQYELCKNRLLEYLEKHQSRYTHVVAYATSNTYRNVFVGATKEHKFSVLPAQPKAKKLTEFFRENNILELVDFLKLHSPSR